LSTWPAILGLSLAMIVVVLLRPVPSSLSYASGILVLISLLGWVLEARQIAGPAPEVEPEHEEEEQAPGPSYWPVLLALGIVGIAAGLIYDWEYGALVVALPLAAGSAAAWASVLKREMMPTPEEAEQLAAGPPIVSGGRMLLPVAPNMLVAQAAGGAAIAIERPQTRQVSRRSLIQITFWSALGAGLLAVVGSTIDFLYPRGVVGFGGVVSPPGTTASYPEGSKTRVSAGKFWLVNLTAEQGGPGFLALWWKCPHLGCTVPWREGFVYEGETGWFRCPCHGSTYNDAGVRVYGPAPRSMDHMQVTIDPSSGRISVNTGAITKGTPDNARFAVQA
jgi:cytochrome b6-f complex iron-sulfur subunit